MGTDTTARNRRLRYQLGEPAPARAVLDAGLQIAASALVPAIFIPVVAFRAGGAEAAAVSWAICVSLLVCGLYAALQALRRGRVGSGFLMAPTAAPAAIAVTTEALRAGGASLLAVLVAATALLQLLLAHRLSWLRRIFTPTVSATVVLLIVVNVMPLIFDLLDNVPAGAPAAAAPVTALATAFVICAFSLGATGAWRIWGPLAGLAAGSLVAAAFGLLDLGGVLRAPWFALPEPVWPDVSAGLTAGFGPAFWVLLPAFAFVTAVNTMQTISGNVAMQTVSFRRQRSVDYRAVQNAVTTSGLINLLAGFVGGKPVSNLSLGAAVVELTGVATRSVGLAAGAALAAVAFLPKLLALILAVPGPVLGVFLVILLAGLFAAGLQLLQADGFDHRKGLIVGVSFWFGVGCQYGFLFPEFAQTFAGGLLANGMTAGGLLAILLTGLGHATQPRASRLRTGLRLAAGAEIQEFLARFASRSGFGKAMRDRLEAVGEETLLTLLAAEESAERPEGRRLRVTARRRGAGATLEFTASTGAENVHDRMEFLGDQVKEADAAEEVSLRLLRHLASSVRHRQYHDVDIVTIRVEAPAESPAP